MQWLNLSDSVNALALLGAVVILILTAFIMALYLKKMKNARSEDETKLEHEWDGIGEFANNVPVGWLACFAGMIIWGFWYFFAGYPLKSFSQIGEYNQEVARYNAAYQKTWENLTQDQLQVMGLGIFQVQCSQCHGPSADGMEGKAQNLVLWGKEEGIIDVIRNGSSGLGYGMDEMSPLDSDTISDDDARAVAAYVMKEVSGVKSTRFENEVERGREIFAEQCVACHGEDGKGSEGMAADLSLYGTTAFLQRVLENGKKGYIGIMPSFNYANFATTQEEALNAYIRSLSVE